MVHRANEPVAAPNTERLSSVKRHLLTVCSSLLLLTGIAGASAQELWFAPPDNLPRGDKVFGPDFDDLFSPGTRWDGALARVEVFQINPRYSFASPEPNLKRVLDSIGHKQTKLAVAMQAVIKRADCGTGLEGMAPPNGAAPIMQRMKRLGADVKFVVMDEPFYFGHLFKGPNGCQYDLNDLVDAIVPSTKAVLKEFPDAQIGETEPVSSSLPPNWLADLAKYLDIYQEKVGRPLSFIQADITWGSNWQPQLRQLQALLKTKNVKLGVIFNAPGPGASDEAWVANAVHNIDTYYNAIRSAPDQAVFASWTIHPSHILPVTSPGALTYVLREYVDRKH
jgi:hypothetical protein